MKTVLYCILFGIAALFIAPFCDASFRKDLQQSVANLPSVGDKKTFTKANIGCGNLAIFEQMISLARAEDYIAAHKLSLYGNCKSFDAGQEFIIEEVNVTHNALQIRLAGDPFKYWVHYHIV